VSEDCARNHLRHLPQWNRGRCRVEVIVNGVDVKGLKKTAENVDRRALRSGLGFGDGVTLLGFFGRFMPQKGFLVLLQALRELARNGFADRVRLVATKDPHGYGEYMGEVERDKELSRMVRFIEPVPNIAAVLPQVDVLAMPSLWEACGLLAMEAMVLGVPVVGSDAIGLREVLRGTPALVPAAADTAQLASAIEATMAPAHSRQAREFMPEAAIRFDNRTSAEKLRTLYDALGRK
jgi:glycosyltransferase involved in cell wall biosynthesis